MREQRIVMELWIHCSKNCKIISKEVWHEYFSLFAEKFSTPDVATASLCYTDTRKIMRPRCGSIESLTRKFALIAIRETTLRQCGFSLILTLVDTVYMIPLFCIAFPSLFARLFCARISLPLYPGVSSIDSQVSRVRQVEGETAVVYLSNSFSRCTCNGGDATSTRAVALKIYLTLRDTRQFRSHFDVINVINSSPFCCLEKFFQKCERYILRERYNLIYLIY